jgi:IS605 OrfB family transposase
LRGSIKSGNFSQDARGRWYCNLVCEVEEERNCGDGEVGVDLGLKTLATCSNGKKFDNKRHFRQLEWKLAGAQRRRKKRQVQTVHAKIANGRRDYNHKVSHELTRDNRLIVIGNINSKVLLKTKMAKSILDVAWGQLHTFVEYKALARGGVYRKQNEAFTTQDCSVCNVRSGPKGREALGVREWVCGECGTVHDRDVNAALNILRMGRHALLAKVQ